jgi:hypothetical protein
MARPRFAAELKGLDSYDLPGLDQEPSDPKNCRIETTLRVGPVGDDSGDDFTLFFVTPAWLADNISADEFRVLAYTVVLPTFRWSLAEHSARTLIDSIESRSWEEFAAAFSRLAYWEHSTDAPPS